MASLAGQSIKGYELLERVGAGGFGAVYRSYQSTIGREVAVKTIFPDYANKPSFIRRFEMEAQFVARLEHLHIVPLYDFWRDPSGAYLVTRWMRGGNLLQALQEGPFDLKRAALLLDQIAAALSLAHSQGVIHGDLKPANILLDEEGNAYLADFSIARILHEPDHSPYRDEGGNTLPHDLVSEQLSGEPVTPLTDIYDFGVLLYQVLTGRHRFADVPPQQRLHEPIDGRLPDITSHGNGVQEAINRVLHKATAKEPGLRFQNALEMAAAFRTAAQLDGNAASLSEALTQREEDILGRIVDGLSNREIAEDLFIEISTVKWYITQIYGKLGVRSRKQAIARVRERAFRPPAAPREAEPPDSPARVAQTEPANPYKGLRAFDISDARDFFGREELVAKLLRRLAATSTPPNVRADNLGSGEGRLLAIVGPSGSGKSSLAMAGLIPALMRGEAPDSEHWYIVLLTPGSRPLDELEIALTRIAAQHAVNLRHHLERDAYGLLRVAELILPSGDGELLLVIDQFEELFTLVQDEVARADFLALLATAAGDARGRVRIILTLRADYYDRPLHYPEFACLLQGQMETVLPLTLDALRRAIMRPAEQVGVGFEPGLVDRIAEDIKSQPGALPLLQYALTELFEARKGFVLTHAAYQSVGGVAGALARRAEDLYQEQDSEGQEAIRQLFLRLVAPNDDATAPDVRQRVPRSELISVIADGDVLDELVDTYAAFRLLTLDHDPQSRGPTVEVAHEALLREWQRLRQWIEASRDDLRLRRDLSRAAEEWRRASEDPSFLLRGTRLEQFKSWSAKTNLALSETESRYLRASAKLRDDRAAAEAARQEREAKLERRARRVLRVLAAVFLLAAVFSGWFALDANRQRREAERNFAYSESQRLAAESEAVLQREGSNELAVLLALRALGARYTPQADLALQRGSGEQVKSVVIEAPGRPFLPLVSPDNRYLRFRRHDAFGFDNQVFEMWDLQAMKPLWQVHDLPLFGHQWTIRDFTADNSGIVLAIKTDEVELTLLDVRSGDPLRTFGGNTSPFVSYQLSADGTILVAGTQDGTVYLWNTATGEVIGRLSLGGERYRRNWRDGMLVAVSPDSRLVVATGQGQTRVWDIESGQELYQFEHATDNSPLQFADGGRILMTADLPGLSLWDLGTGQEVKHHIPFHQTIHRSVTDEAGLHQLSPDARYYVDGLVGLMGDDLIIWDVTTGQLRHRLTGHTRGAYPFDFSADSRRLVTGGGEGTVRVWDVSSGQELLALTGHSAVVSGADLSADGHYLVTTGWDDTVRVWDLQAPVRRGDDHLEGVSDILLLSPNGRVALTVNPDNGAAVLGEPDSFNVLHQLDLMLDTARPVFSSDSQMVVGVRDLTTILVYDVNSGELLGEYVNPDGAYRYAAFVPGRRSIFAGGDRSAYLLDAETGERLHTYTPPDGGLYGAKSGFVTVSANGRYGAIHMWTMNSLNVVYLWNLETGALEYSSTPTRNDVISALAFSADSRYFAWGGSSNNANVLDLQNLDKVMTLVHPNPVLGLDFSADHRLLLTSALDDSVYVWDLETREVVRQFFAGTGPADFVDFIEDDEFVLYTTHEDGVIHRQPLAIDDLLEIVCSTLQRDLTPEQRRTYGVDDSPTCPVVVGP